jgi:hypothetical protein
MRATAKPRSADNAVSTARWKRVIGLTRLRCFGGGPFAFPAKNHAMPDSFPRAAGIELCRFRVGFEALHVIKRSEYLRRR